MTVRQAGDAVAFAPGGRAGGHTLSAFTDSGAGQADLLAESFRHELGPLAEAAAV